MADLSCTYLGLNLRNPVVVGSSGLTSSIENLKTIEKAGAGAVVLKSVFEEQIEAETATFSDSENPAMKAWNETLKEIRSKNENYYDEAFEYLTGYARENSISKYLELVTKAKNEISIPVIASINCYSSREWQFFSKMLQDAGADALELNIFVLPSDLSKSGQDNEEIYLNIIREVKKYVTIPVSLKTGFYFSGLAGTLLKFSESGISGLTLFNRPYNPDIDIEELTITASNIFSNEAEYALSLRWVALLSGKLKCDIAASTGIHNYQTIVKQILAGADAVHMASAFYRNAPGHFDIIPGILAGINGWMRDHKFDNINDFKGLLSSSRINYPSVYERVQFLKLFSSVT